MTSPDGFATTTVPIWPSPPLDPHRLPLREDDDEIGYDRSRRYPVNDSETGYPETSLYEFTSALEDHLADTLTSAGELHEIALLKHGPLTDEKKNKVRTASRTLVLLIRQALITAEQLEQQADRL